MGHPAQVSPRAFPALEFGRFDFGVAPFLLIWEVTRACPLACRHCRASADLTRDPGELTTEEGKALLEACRDMGTAVVVLTGGDPLMREDLPELVAHGARLGLRMATIPAASDHLRREHLVALKEAGLAQMALSLDGSTAERHDGFRRVPGTFERTLRAAAWARELGLPLQINTTFARENFDDLPALADLVESLGVVFWEVFSLVPVGRGVELTPLSAEEHEQLFALLHALSERVSFVVKVTEAPHYRRYVLEQRAKHGLGHGGSGGPSGSAIPAQLSRELTARQSFGARARGINAGKGFCFVSHTGELHPSGFFLESAGNVRDAPLADLYRDSPLFKSMRDPALLQGHCGGCRHRDVCGGSRSRALAVSGDPLAEDPACLPR